MSSPRTVVFTSANRAYLDRVKVLRDSLRRSQPEWPLVLVLVDEPEAGDERLDDVADRVLYARDLRIDDFRSWIFGHDAIEACTAVKGQALVDLLDEGWDRVVYLDPDMAVMAPLDTVGEALELGDVALTPHQLTPDDDPRAVLDNEVGSLRHGVYNLGFLAVRNSSEGRRFAAWWRDRLRHFCLDDLPLGLFTDQRWLDHAPVFFPTMTILRDPGMNVASWNLSQRPITERDGEYLSAGEPLRLVHFTKARSVGPLMTQRYGGDSLAVAELWRWYLEELDSAGHRVDITPPWSYGFWPGQHAIPLAARRIYRMRGDLKAAHPDPFGEDFHHWWQITGGA